MAKRKVLFWLKDGIATDEQRELAGKKGAQFRNSYYYDAENEEPADEVLGDVPEGSYKGVKGGSKLDPEDTDGKTDKTSGGSSQDEEEEEEITAEYINGLLKADLIELATEESIQLSGSEKVDGLKEILLKHFQLQE